MLCKNLEKWGFYMRITKIFTSILFTVLIAIGYSFISGKLFNMTFLFPFIVAILIYGIARSTFGNLDGAVKAFALFLGIIAYSTYIFSGYQIFKSEVKREVKKLAESKDLNGGSEEEFAKYIEDLYLKENTGQTGFVGYMISRTNKVELFHSFAGEEKVTGPTALGIISEIISFVLIIFLPAIMVKKRPRRSVIYEE